MFHWCTGGAEHSDFAAALEAFEHPKGFVQFAQGLQRYLDVPAVAVILGHAQHREHHVAVQRQVFRARSHLIDVLFNLAGQVETVALKVSG